MFSLSKFPHFYPLPFWRVSCLRLIGNVANIEQEYSEVPMYPPIDVVSLRDKWIKPKLDWHSKIASLPTVEQKLIELNMPKYYGYKSVVFKDTTLKPQSLEFVKFATRTQILKYLPEQYYEETEANLNQLVESIRTPVKDLISLYFGNITIRHEAETEKEKEKLRQDNFIHNLNQLLLKALRNDLVHMSTSSVDLHPRIEGFWFLGGFEPSTFLKNKYKKIPYTEPLASYPIDRAMRSSIFPSLSLRMGDGLSEVFPLDATLDDILQTLKPKSTEGETTEHTTKAVPMDVVEKSLRINPFETHPKYWGLESEQKMVVIIPGFWPGVKHEHGLLFFHSRHMDTSWQENFKEWYDESLARVMMQQNLMISAFTQAQSYALYQGFTPVNELTYPIVQQSVFTDGQKFQFGLYQMNTCALHSSFSVDNPRTNFLWMPDDMKLFDSVEGTTVKGFNEDVLKILCSMYLKKGKPRQNPHPYLADYKYVMHHDAPNEFKEEFQKYLRYYLSERPRPQVVPEILPFELIYKVYFPTRLMDKKTKFFEAPKAMNPYTRRLDDYSIPHIPRVRRLMYNLKYQPRIHSELLFKHDKRSLHKPYDIYDDDKIVFKTMGINKDTPPFYNGLLWSRAMHAKPKI